RKTYLCPFRQEKEKSQGCSGQRARSNYGLDKIPLFLKKLQLSCSFFIVKMAENIGILPIQNHASYYFPPTLNLCGMLWRNCVFYLLQFPYFIKIGTLCP
ncbi:MAG: hypothetical protein AAB276_03675, partial [Pseudomonadota bacterium]